MKKNIFLITLMIIFACTLNVEARLNDGAKTKIKEIIKGKIRQNNSHSLNVSSVEISGRKLFVDDKEFVIKGVGYQPVPIGMSIGEWEAMVSASNIEGPGGPNYNYIHNLAVRDFTLLKEMGANTIRTWSIPSIAIMDAAEQFGIKVCAGFWIPYEMDFRYAYTGDLEQQFREFVQRFKNYNCLLMWCLGNEYNYWGPQNAYAQKAFYEFMDELGAIAREIEGSQHHPVAIVNGDLDYIGDSYYSANDASLTHIDIWAANIYRGTSFGNLFQEYSTKSAKPLLSKSTTRGEYIRVKSCP